jgi:hypothetical protein
MPTDVLAAGALVLLYGMTVYRVRSLTADHLSYRDDQPYLKIGHQPVPLPPRLARLLERVQPQQIKQARLGKVLPGTRWLFPGLNPGMPVYAGHLEAKLLLHGISSRSARHAALIGLAADLPSPVLADLFGLHISTAVRWARMSRRDWTDFVAQRVADAEITDLD